MYSPPPLLYLFKTECFHIPLPVTAMNSPRITKTSPKTRKDNSPHHMATSLAFSLVNRYWPSCMTASTSSAERDTVLEAGRIIEYSSSLKLVRRERLFFTCDGFVICECELISCPFLIAPLSKSTNTDTGWTEFMVDCVLASWQSHCFMSFRINWTVHLTIYPF